VEAPPLLKSDCAETEKLMGGCPLTPCCASGLCEVPMRKGEFDGLLNNEGIAQEEIPERLRHIVWGLLKMDEENPLQDRFSIAIMSGVLFNIAHIMPWDGTCDEERSRIRWWICKRDGVTPIGGLETPMPCRATQQTQ
jgi:hypothetical protein